MASESRWLSLTSFHWPSNTPNFVPARKVNFYSVVIKCGDEIEIMSLIIALSVALIVYNFLVELTSVILNICVICSTSSVK